MRSRPPSNTAATAGLAARTTRCAAAPPTARPQRVVRGAQADRVGTVFTASAAGGGTPASGVGSASYSAATREAPSAAAITADGGSHGLGASVASWETPPGSTACPKRVAVDHADAPKRHRRRRGGRARRPRRLRRRRRVERDPGGGDGGGGVGHTGDRAKTAASASPPWQTTTLAYASTAAGPSPPW